QLENFAFDVDGDLLGKVAVGHRGGDVGDVANLVGQVSGHRVHRVSEVLPSAGHAGNVRLAAKFALGADFARHPRHFGGERPELVANRRSSDLQLEDFAFDVDGDLLGEVAAGDRGGDGGDVADLRGEVSGHRVDRVC